MSGERMVTHWYSYALNPASGEVHRVIVSRGSIRMSGEQCNLDDTGALELINDEAAKVAYVLDRDSWCGHCATRDDIEGAPV